MTGPEYEDARGRSRPMQFGSNEGSERWVSRFSIRTERRFFFFCTLAVLLLGLLAYWDVI